jgi:hypothetical protein
VVKGRVPKGRKREPIKIRKEEKEISKGAAMPMAAQIFGYFFGERTWREIFRTVSLVFPVVSS